jgi:hypothetical protein
MENVRTRPHPVTAGALSRDQAQRLAKGLGLFSLALGAAEVAAPHALARWLGMKGSAQLLRAYGLREIGAGLGILVDPHPTNWVWARAAGDALDIATLSTGLSETNRKRSNVALALLAVVGVTVADVLCAQSLGQQQAQVRRQRLRAVRDYRERSGFNRPARAMRGAAGDFEVPADMRVPELLRPYEAREAKGAASPSQ